MSSSETLVDVEGFAAANGYLEVDTAVVSASATKVCSNSLTGLTRQKLCTGKPLMTGMIDEVV